MGKIAFLLPGLGYHADKPLLYHSKRILEQHGYTVHSVTYRPSDKTKVRGDVEAMRKVAEGACEDAIQEFLPILNQLTKEDRVVFVSKSIGTVAAAFVHEKMHLPATHILYTPVEKTFDFIKGLPGEKLVFTGSNDNWVHPGSIEELCQTLHIPYVLIPQANHSLETDDAIKNLQILSDVMRRTEGFLTDSEERIPAKEDPTEHAYSVTDIRNMQHAVFLAKQGIGGVNPNPLVGAVIVKDGRIIGEGCHLKYGEPHAERNALAACKESPEGATIYVTLEPCCHQGKQPPCTQALIEHGIRRVVIGSPDPNPLVQGKGVSILRNAGIIVDTDCLREECDALNPVFFHYITKKTPYIAMKYAMTADGKIATVTGESKWITGEAARKHVHTLRQYYKAILVGIETVLKDDPELSCRLTPEDSIYHTAIRQPIRIVCDSHLRISTESRILRSIANSEVILLHTDDPNRRSETLSNLGATLIRVSADSSGHVNLTEAMERLHELGIDGILVEGGGEIHGSLLTAGLVNHVYAYVGAKLVGGKQARSPICGEGIERIADCLNLCNPKITVFDEDVLLEYSVQEQTNL